MADNKKVAVAVIRAMDMSKVEHVHDTEVKPFPVPIQGVEVIGVPLQDIPRTKHEKYMRLAVVDWLRQVGLLQGTKLTVEPHVLSLHGQYVFKKDDHGHERLVSFTWDDKVVVAALYH